MSRTRWLATTISCAVLSITPTGGLAQDGTEVTPELLAEVVPNASRFGPRQGSPPVFEAFATDSITGTETRVGFAFVTSDLPPEVQGYTAPIMVLVGMDLEGRLTGIELLAYRESLRGSRGDFLNRSSYLRQFAGKHVVEGFRVREDIDGISGATITVDAMSRGIRNAARRVAAAYLSGEPATPSYIGTTTVASLEDMLWAEMLERGLATQVSILGGPIRMVLSIVYLAEPAVGDLLVGETNFRAAMDTLGIREEPHHLMLMGLGGEDPFFFRPSGLSFVQDTDTISVPQDDLIMLPLLRDGKLQGEVRRSGVLYVDGALDLSRPFEVVLDLGPRGERAANSYQVMPPRLAAATGGSAPPPDPSGGAAVMDASPPPLPGPADAETAASAEGTGPGASEGSSESLVEGPLDAAAGEPAGVPPSVALAAESADQAIDYEALLFEEEETEQSALVRVLERTSWARVLALALLLALTTWAFVAKRSALRWATLGATFLILGYVDGGFLSVSHILAGISVGPSVYLSDIPLLMLVVFTVVTTLLWGRVFCGYLCPFGALQDFLERVVPARFQKEPPPWVHRRALWIKYAILALVLAPAVVGSSLSLFQYFEPFGTVFYWSSSILLWSIAAGILVASAIVPRFYCRYACPLGAALALGSVVAPFRIRRVEQCDFCKVCELRCPTGAIEGPKIDFKECVRCNVCEIQLIEKTGVCRHDMDAIRHRLVTLPMAGTGALDV